MSKTPNKSRSARRSKIHVHIENVSTYTDHTQVRPKHLADAARRHPDVARHIDTTVSWDFKGFDRHMKSAKVLIFMGIDFDPANFAARAPKLDLIQLTCAGVDHFMPFDWLPKHVTVANNGGVHADKEGEFALTAVLMLNHSVPFMVTNQRNAKWKQRFGSAVKGKTLAVIGVGEIGGAAAAKAKRLGMRVIGVRRSGKRHAAVEEMYTPRDLRRVLGQADFVLVTLPLTAETRKIIDRRALGWMRPGAGLVNIGRGANVDYVALAEALKSGRLSGAVLDAYEEEPLPSSSFLWNTPNLIMSPHCSSSDVEQYIPMTLDIAYENLRRYMAGKPLLNRIDKGLGY
jgi:phosphoglycerate dehydrogenase-like enzyme